MMKPNGRTLVVQAQRANAKRAASPWEAVSTLPRLPLREYFAKKRYEFPVRILHTLCVKYHVLHEKIEDGKL